MPDPGRMLDEIQRLVLGVLLRRSGGGVCSMGELVTAVGDEDMAELAVVALHATGLVHRLEGFVFATLAAARFHELDLAGLRVLAQE